MTLAGKKPFSFWYVAIVFSPWHMPCFFSGSRAAILLIISYPTFVILFVLSSFVPVISNGPNGFPILMCTRGRTPRKKSSQAVSAP